MTQLPISAVLFSILLASSSGHGERGVDVRAWDEVTADIPPTRDSRPDAARCALIPDPGLCRAAGDLVHLERLWTALAATFAGIIEERAAITSVSLDGEDVFERRLGEKLVERLVMVLAPTTLEVARRSPNQHELSLKRESESGRREEFYLKRDNLLEGLQPLPHGGRAVFAPLGLDTWVPATTVRPPDVGPPGRVEELVSIDIEEG